MVRDEDDLVTISDDPLCRVDFGKFSVGDYMEFVKDYKYIAFMLKKYCIDDLDSMPIEHAPRILQKFAEEFSKYTAQLVNSQLLLDQVYKVATHK